MTTVFEDRQMLSCPHALSLDEQGNLYVLSNEWPLFLSGEKGAPDLEYNILRCGAKELIKGTACDASLST